MISSNLIFPRLSPFSEIWDFPATLDFSASMVGPDDRIPRGAAKDAWLEKGSTHVNHGIMD